MATPSQNPLPVFKIGPTATPEMIQHGVTRANIRKVLEKWWNAGGHVTGAIRTDCSIAGRKLAVSFEYDPEEAPPIRVYQVGWTW